MQIVRTEVAQATGLSGKPILRVVFCGEGGDCVTVDMASVEAGSDDAALDRARAILVQTATFGRAGNDYDAESNGNFDEVAVTAANEEYGGLYIFEYRDGEGKTGGFLRRECRAWRRRASRRSGARSIFWPTWNRGRTTISPAGWCACLVKMANYSTP